MWLSIPEDRPGAGDREEVLPLGLQVCLGAQKTEKELARYAHSVKGRSRNRARIGPRCVSGCGRLRKVMYGRDKPSQHRLLCKCGKKARAVCLGASQERHMHAICRSQFGAHSGQRGADGNRGVFRFAQIVVAVGSSSWGNWTDLDLLVTRKRSPAPGAGWAVVTSLLFSLGRWVHTKSAIVESSGSRFRGDGACQTGLRSSPGTALHHAPRDG